LSPGEEILVPAYHHGSEVEALVRAGFVCRFYDATLTLEPEQAELERLLGPRTRALYVIHYLGFPQDVKRWRRWCDEHGLFLIEDAAQAWLASREGLPVGSLGDLSVFCLYKSIGVPDGAALLSKSRPELVDGSRPFGIGGLVRRHGTWLMARSRVLATLGTWAQWESEYDPQEDFALGDPESRASRASLVVLAHAAETEVATRRRTNFRALLDALSETVPEPFGQVPDGASPFAFPVQTSDKSQLLARLNRQCITALDFWAVPHRLLPAAQFPEAARRRQCIVGLPVHQELRPQDIERVIGAAGTR
jgi:dTDP-4-amino-4,6-dideoxygalactose transaminase